MIFFRALSCFNYRCAYETIRRLLQTRTHKTLKSTHEMLFHISPPETIHDNVDGVCHILPLRVSLTIYLKREKLIIIIIIIIIIIFSIIVLSRFHF